MTNAYSETHAGEHSCRICQALCNTIQIESRKGQTFTVLKCSGCGTVQTREHYGSVSPDFLSLSKVTPSHIEMGRKHKHHAYKQWLQILNSRGVKPSVVADVGCGTGGFIEFLQSNGIRAVGFDASAAQVDYAKSQNIDAECATTVTSFLKLRPDLRRTSSTVCVWDVFEHIRDPIPFLREMKELLAPGGHLFISVPSAGGHQWKRPLHRLVKGSYSFDPWEHVFYYNEKSLRFVLRQAGFDVVETGAVECYRRSFSVTELARRAAFKALKYTPWSPQIYALAR